MQGNWFSRLLVQFSSVQSNHKQKIHTIGKKCSSRSPGICLLTCALWRRRSQHLAGRRGNVPIPVCRRSRTFPVPRILSAGRLWGDTCDSAREPPQNNQGRNLRNATGGQIQISKL